MRYLFLDDERFPPDTPLPWEIVRSYNEAVAYVKENGIPGFISFDHDIQSEPENGYTFSKWLVEQDLDGTHCFPDNFDFEVHSANPVGAENIRQYLNLYLSHRKKENEKIARSRFR
jgi:hypothetical protein